jgi:hypothetical protein
MPYIADCSVDPDKFFEEILNIVSTKKLREYADLLNEKLADPKYVVSETPPAQKTEVKLSNLQSTDCCNEYFFLKLFER